MYILMADILVQLVPLQTIVAFLLVFDYTSSLWSYYNGNLGSVTPYSVIVKLPSNTG